MPLTELNAILGGPQGSGIETSMMIIGRALARRGYGFLANREYFSNIVGRHSYIHLRVKSDEYPRSLTYPVDLLVAMDAETIFMHFEDVSNRGFIVCDNASLHKTLEEAPSIEDITRERIKKRCNELGLDCSVESILKYLAEKKNASLISLQYEKIIRELFDKYKIDPRQLSRYLSGIVFSAFAVLLALDEDSLRYALSLHFKERVQIVEQNMDLYRIVVREMGGYKGALILAPPRINQKKTMFVTGNDIVAIAKIVAGVRYQSYYPITPAADESVLLERYSFIEDENIGPLLVLQTEDEIAAITSAIGASLTGARSSTSTSGPGFDLMVEGLSWAGMNEAPVVITYYQRGGPSTGQPTRGSQSDLFNAIFAGHGEFARVVLSSGDHLEAFYDTILAFNLAEEFQVPVIHLLDKFLANSTATISLPRLDEIKISRGTIVREAKEYKRFSLASLVSPRAFLGTRGVVMWYTGDEHDEYGHIVEDPENRIAMYSKRIEKISLIKDRVPSEQKIGIYGDRNPDYVFVGWGSVKNTVLEAIDVLRGRGIRAKYLNIKMLWPFPEREFVEAAEKVPADRMIVVEHSYGANIAKLIEMNTGISIEKSIVKFTGRPLTLKEVIEGFELIESGKEKKVVCRYGA